MALGLNCNPANINVGVQYSLENAAVLNESIIAFAPTNQGATGTFDLSSATSYAVVMNNGQSNVVSLQQNSPPNTKISGTSTGGSLSISAVNLSNAITPLLAGGPTSGKISITATDGTNTVLVAQGSWNAAFIP